MLKHTKEFGIYYWDTSLNRTTLLEEADLLEDAISFVEKNYAGLLHKKGRHRIEIFQNRSIVKAFTLT